MLLLYLWKNKKFGYHFPVSSKSYSGIKYLDNNWGRRDVGLAELSFTRFRAPGWARRPNVQSLSILHSKVIATGLTSSIVELGDFPGEKVQ